MNSTWVIAKRELNSFFDSLMAYMMIIIFLGLSGFFTWLSSSSNVFLIGQADMQVFFSISFWTLFFFIPAITMRSLAEENRSGTIELLSTKPISDWNIVTGKFLSCLLLVGIAILCTIPYYWSVSSLGNVDHGAIIGGYFGLLLLSGMYISIGIFASSITQNQIVAFLLALFIGIFFHILFDIIGSSQTGWTGALFNFLSARSHFESISRGVVDTRDIFYFLSIIVLGLLLSQIMLSKRNWQD
ncbi:ABC transporter permease subunit [Membranihabitans maritimus]|uniref:ABC transporter permease subunit n=1 Tax=Membranihabitans maritimus TaxID=2904244 RepID=UPI001F00EA6B|nr:ABC transporter permease subunit [Membranihabitans maritimus]